MPRIKLKILKLKYLLLILLFSLSLTISGRVFAQVQSTDPLQLLEQGKQLYQAGQFREAIPIWQQAIEILPDNSLNQATALSNLSLTYQQLGEWETANQAISQSLEVLNGSQTTTEQQRILAQTLDIQGQFKQKIGQSQAALNIWRQAANLYVNSEDKKSNQINQAQAMQDLGLYPRACQTLLETLGLKQPECYISEQEIATIKQETLEDSANHLHQAKALRSLGNVLRVIGDFKKSEKVLQASLDIVQKRNLPQEEGKTLLNLGNTQRSIANRAQEIEDYREEKIYREKALLNYQKAARLSLSTLQIQSQLNQIELLMEDEKWEQAQLLISQIKSYLPKLITSREAFFTKINYAKNMLCLKQKNLSCLNPKKADLSSVDPASLREAIQILENVSQDGAQIEDRRTQSSVAGLLGRIYESQGEWQQANQYTQQALSKSWQSQSSDLTYQWQWQQGRLLKAQGKSQEALQSYEQAVNTLKSLRSDLISINPEIQFTFRESIEPIYREYVGLLLKPKETAEDIPLENIQLARQTIDSLQLAELENFFRLVCLDANPVVIDQVTDKNDPTAAVIYPILLEDRFEIILKLPKQPLRHYTTPIKDKEEVERTLAVLTESLTEANNGQTLDLAQIVYNWILRPAEADLEQSQIKTLVFVLDSALRNVPMSVLNDGQKYLVEKYSIALIPSLQLLDPQPLRQYTSQTLVAGLSEARGNFPALPFVPQELKEIQLQNSSNVELLNQKFTKDNLGYNMNSAPFSVVHLATHGQFSSQAEGTFILTWDDRLNINQLNELLRSRNTAGSSPIELLVLSACETLKGDNRASLGLAGVAVRAGARSTLATLWQVNDQTTSILMSQFYAALNDPTAPKSKADALRKAQLVLLNNPEYKSPHFWSAYVLVGNWL